MRRKESARCGSSSSSAHASSRSGAMLYGGYAKEKCVALAGMQKAARSSAGTVISLSGESADPPDDENGMPTDCRIEVMVSSRR